MIPTVIGCCGGGIKELKNDLKEIFDEKEIEHLVYEMQKMVLWESETTIRKVMSGLIE